MKRWSDPLEFLEYLNKTYSKRHYDFEKYFWLSAMGDHSVNQKKDIASERRDIFRNDESLLHTVETFLKRAKGETKERLRYWKNFFSLYQVPMRARELKKKIDELQTKIETIRATRKEGYIHPVTKNFISASSSSMASTMATNDDEKIRKACFDARQKLPLAGLGDYVKLVKIRNQYARMLGYQDFYAYKLDVEEGMTKKELFSLFDKIYAKTKYVFKNIRRLEKEKMSGLRKPWNFSYMLAGSFTKEEDPYFPFETALERWGKSFAALGIDYKKGNLTLDLLDRKGKYNNGFCHWPKNVHYIGKKRISGLSNFTCNVVLGSPGDAKSGLHTLFHEGGHAAHLLNADLKDVCVTTEYPPLSTAWAETQSMFLDSVFSSIEWTSRYAKNVKGEPYPFDLYKRKVEQTGVVRPLGTLMSVAQVCEFEKIVYEEKKLTSNKVVAIAKKVYKKYTDFDVQSNRLLEIPHIYSWESACSYQGYGLATLALTQWREYFYDKYGFIVDNLNVGKEMEKVWVYGGSKTFSEFVRIATGKKLSADAYIKNVIMSNEEVLKKAKQKISTLAKKPTFRKKIRLNADIKVVHGKKVIADDKKGFEEMARKYASWLKTQYPKKVAERAIKK